MWPKDVGIRALEVYFPSQYVDQTELEKFDNVSAGKYTVGLGQAKMGFCTDREDINSLCLTVTHRLLERYDVKPQDIGRLEVGTETIIDKSKSVKTILMQLFEPSGNTDMEGIDLTNACYGGTAALLNAVSWVESSAWDGRLALVVCADNAVYSKGSARPTGGCGAVAMLVGPDAPLVFDRGTRSSCMRHAYDFYKPDLKSEYPIVDGKLSIQCYLSALDSCYQKFSQKTKAKTNADVSLDYFDGILFHSPFCKLVQKSFARLALVDFVTSSKSKSVQNHVELQKFSNVVLEDSYFDKDVEKAFLASSKSDFEKKTKPSLLIANQVGNMYTPSVYSGLISFLIHKPVEALAGNKVGLFSYGSGFASTMYSISISKDSGPNSSLRRLVNNLSYVKTQLATRKEVHPQQYTNVLASREKNCHLVPYEPQSGVDHLFPGTYYLVKIDEMYRRTYNRIPNSK